MRNPKTETEYYKAERFDEKDFDDTKWIMFEEQLT